MTTISFQNLEGESIHTPPLFNGDDYNYWKIRMRIYLQSIDYSLWNIIENGPHLPTKIINSISVPKEPHEYSEDDERKLSLNARAMNVLYCALERNEFDHISSCHSAQAIWQKLEDIHEGTSQVRESKINTHIAQYEFYDDLTFLNKRYEETKGESNDQQEVPNKCFMAINEVTSSTSSCINDFEKDFYTQEEVNKALQELCKDNNLRKKNDLLLEEIKILKNVNFSLEKSNHDFSLENASLKNKVEDLTKIVHKFSNGKKNFDLILGNQRCIFGKGGIRYKPFVKQKYLMNYFVKSSTSLYPKYVCYYCNQNGHKSFSCDIKKNAYFGTNLAWVPKLKCTNIKGPKAIWVPKSEN